MAINILDRYGIKEVADFTFYDLNSDGTPRAPVLFLDTLKISTIEQTGEETEARGGKGNAALIAWDFNKDINVTIEDALFSAKSLAVMFGNGTVGSYSGSNAYIMRTEQFVATDTTIPTESLGVYSDASGWTAKYEGPDGKLYVKHNPKFFNADSTPATTSFVKGETYFCSYDVLVNAKVIDVSANTFPGTWTSMLATA